MVPAKDTAVYSPRVGRWESTAKEERGEREREREREWVREPEYKIPRVFAGITMDITCGFSTRFLESVPRHDDKTVHRLVPILWHRAAVCTECKIIRWPLYPDSLLFSETLR